MRIPEVAQRLRELAATHSLPELATLAGELSRRRPRQRAPAESVTMTPYLARQIRDYARNHPELTQRAIGEVFNVNPGRVSEITQGKRT